MITYKPGEFVFSKSGHDKGNLYIIVKEDEEYVYLADGKHKMADNPKKKNKKHVQMVHYEDECISDKINKNVPLSDLEIGTAIRKALKRFRTVD